MILILVEDRHKIIKNSGALEIHVLVICCTGVKSDSTIPGPRVQSWIIIYV